MNIRAAAASVIYDVIEDGRSLADSLPEMAGLLDDARDRALLQAICFGVCRHFFSLDAIAQKLLDKPLKPKDQNVYALLLVGLYQLIYMRIPAYAAVTETVAATKNFKKIWAKGLINGVLRRYQREAEILNRDLKIEATFSHPSWIIERLQKSYPADDVWKQILDANNEHPPFSLRVNQKQISRNQYLEKLTAEGIEAQIIPETQSGVVLTEPMDVKQLPGFASGEVSVQDGAAQLAAELLALAPNQRVLDACAAPGGKTAHILEIEPTTECVAVDIDESRLDIVRENLDRLGLSAQCIAADVGKTASWWDGKLFDRILLDAPCSASGVIRRHPDIKLLRRDTDIEALVETQSRLLNALWPLLKPGGLFVYATCSVFPEENVKLLQAFLETNIDAKEEKISSSWGRESAIGKQILPGMHGMDGFYYACLRK